MKCATGALRARRLVKLACLWGALCASGCRHGGPSPTSVAKPIVAAVLPDVKGDARAEFSAGLLLLKQGKKHQSEARARFVKAAELEPKFFEAWHNLGWLDASRGNFARAANEFRKALDIQPASRATAMALGEAWRRAGSFKKAARFYGERLAAAPTDGELRNRYIQVLRDAGDLPEALNQTRMALGQAGDNVNQTVFAYNSLGLIYYKMEKFELAETALRKALDLDGKSPFVWNNLGLVAFARGRDQEAFVNFQKASEFDPKFAEARINKAVIYLDCGDYKRARTELQKAIDANDDDADAYVALGVAARGQGKFEDARKAYEKALDLEPEHAAALFDSGILFMDYDKSPARARDSFQLFLDVADEDDGRRKDAEDRLKELKASEKRAATSEKKSAEGKN